MSKRKMRLSLKTALFKGAYVHNTVLTTLTGLCTVSAVCISVKNALWLSLVFSVILILCEVSAGLFIKRFERWFRVGFYTLLSSVALLIPMFFMDETTSSAFGVYLPLLCVNGVIVIRCEKFAVRTTGYNAFIDALAGSVGFLGVAFLTGLVRELIITGKFLGVQTSLPTVSAASMPFFGFLVIGFIGAFHKWTVKTFFPNELTDTFGMSKAFDKPVLKDPGIKRMNYKEERKKQEAQKLDYEKIKPRYSIEEIELPSENKEDKS